MALGCLRKYKEEIECYKKALEIDPEYKDLKILTKIRKPLEKKLIRFV
ncbi:unnamed protein product [marine sediment metagenome]|uniref:Uncharacterized protein n=1 Tax=marine sediment metagenome TaxID=412755 RepID=X0WDV1_9ZZZZ